MSANNTKKTAQSQTFSGVYTVKKERGETLADLLLRFRDEHLLSVDTKLTYAGRLDPMAEGFVLILAGEDRFQKDALLGLPKVYEVEVLLGIATDTHDPLGLIDTSSAVAIDESAIRNVVAQMTTVKKLPYPLYSSVPVEGKPLFLHARAGTTVEVPEKKVTIHSAELLASKSRPIGEIAHSVLEDIKKVHGDFRQQEIAREWEKLVDKKEHVQIVSIRVHASSGTYMRSLAVWMGERLGVPALAYRINRLSIGEYGK